VTHTVILRGNRDFAHRLIQSAPEGSVMKVSKPTRTLDQNNRLWAMLSEISAAKPEGRELTPESWKAIFCHALGHEQRFEMALDGKGFVPLGFRTSRMTKEQFSDLFLVIEEYAARNNIKLKGDL
jgi:hypothetical protein